jgi:ubiquinone/menaquinone biosynthesis C-methylase UbiE
MPQKEDSYAALADLYDLEAKNKEFKAFYREWREALLQAIHKYKIHVRTLVDLACGTGNSTIPWSGKRGWIIVGVDCSRAMLRKARKKSRRVRWYCQDLRKLRLRERAEVVTCHFDALNHILDLRSLQNVFRRVATTLNDGGLFQFDMDTVHLFRWAAARQTLFRVGPHYFVAHNEYDAKRMLLTGHQTWFVKKGKAYYRREVTVRERAYPASDIRRMLKHAGLSLLKADIQRKLRGKPFRMVYLAKKTTSAARI